MSPVLHRLRVLLLVLTADWVKSECCGLHGAYPGSDGQGPICLGDLGCCPDGAWGCFENSGGLRCGNETLFYPDLGEICKNVEGDDDVEELLLEESPCCDVKDTFATGSDGLGSICLGDLGCCPDGTWGCFSADGGLQCGNETLFNSNFGAICETGDEEEEEVLLVEDPICCIASVKPNCFQGFPQCCPLTGSWSCPSDFDSTEYPCGNTTITSGFGETCQDTCLFKDLRICPDGTEIFRDPTLDCQFPDCPAPTKTCCPRNVSLDCLTGGPTQCCPDGTYACALPQQQFVQTRLRGSTNNDTQDNTPIVFEYLCGEEIITSGFSEICPAEP